MWLSRQRPSTDGSTISRKMEFLANKAHTATFHCCRPRGTRRSSTIILDSGCSRSCVNDPSQLQELVSAPRKMWTANGGHSSATHEGRLASRIPALAKLKASLIPDFQKGLVSLGEMDDLGIVWQGGGGKWSFYDSDGEFLVEVQKGNDNLWHFPEKVFGKS